MNNVIDLPSSVLSHEASPRMSSKYSFFNTTDVIEAMHEKGFLVSSANQRGQSLHGQHIVRMRHESVLDAKELVPEVVIRNSHNGQTPLTFMAGLYRLVCSNGLVVGRTEAQIALYHRPKNTMLEVMNAMDEIHEISIQSLEASKSWSQIKMDEDARAHFTKLVGVMVKDDPKYFEPSTLLQARYDEESNLWTCFNLAQESLTRGCLNASGRKLRGINGVRGNTVMNRQLWELAENLAAA